MPNLMLDDDAFLASATIDWTNPRAAGKEENVRGIVETKIHDRFRTWRAKLRKLYYVPFENSEQRKHCDDPRVIQTQWQALVAHWDKMENKRRCATNAKNRKMLKTSHTIGTTFTQISNDYAEEHDGNESHVGTCRHQHWFIWSGYSTKYFNSAARLSSSSPCRCGFCLYIAGLTVSTF
ncbi:unnamed protein product [Malus baccata var. baccata]